MRVEQTGDSGAPVIPLPGSMTVFPGYDEVPQPRRTEIADATATTVRAVQTPDSKLAYARDYLRHSGVIDAAPAEKYAPLMARSDFATAAEYLREDVLDDKRADLASPMFSTRPSPEY